MLDGRSANSVSRVNFTQYVLPINDLLERSCFGTTQHSTQKEKGGVNCYPPIYTVSAVCVHSQRWHLFCMYMHAVSRILYDTTSHSQFKVELNCNLDVGSGCLVFRFSPVLSEFLSEQCL